MEEVHGYSDFAATLDCDMSFESIVVRLLESGIMNAVTRKHAGEQKMVGDVRNFVAVNCGKWVVGQGCDMSVGRVATIHLSGCSQITKSGDFIILQVEVDSDARIRRWCFVGSSWCYSKFKEALLRKTLYQKFGLEVTANC